MKRILHLFLLFFIFGLSGNILHAQQAGANDPTFNPIDIGFGNGDAANNSVRAVALQADGKVVIGGYFTNYNTITSINRIARLNTDGTLDASFNVGTGANGVVTSIAIQPDGKIIIAGDFTSFNGTNRSRIARLNPDGTLDATFNIGTGADNLIEAMALLPNGKIIIAGGSLNMYNGTIIASIVRLNANGTLDPSFQAGSAFGVNCLAIQPDGYIVIGGTFTKIAGANRNRMARLEPDGSLDNIFNPGAGPDAKVWTVAVQLDGQIVIGGYFSTYNGTNRTRIARLNANGSLDTGFSPPSLALYASHTVEAIAIQPDGKIIIGGSFNNSGKYNIARLNQSGSLDTGFDPKPYSSVGAITLQPNGKIIVGGAFNGFTVGSLQFFRNGIARLNTDGSVDSGFNAGTGANNTIYSTAIQADGKIIAGGQFIAYNGVYRLGSLRANSNGSVDNNFPYIGANAATKSLEIQSNGKVIIGGSESSSAVLRLNTDGSKDNSFNIGTGSDYNVNTVKLQPDGKILVGGRFFNFNGQMRKHIVRLNSTGSIDNGFSANLNAPVNAFAVQPDGKIIVVGNFTSYGNVTPKSRNGIARLNIDGSLDNSFDPGTGANDTIMNVALQPDGKIVIVGKFNSYNGSSRVGIARVNADGTLDASFDAGLGANGRINTIALHPSGKILIGGKFTSYNGIVRNNIARLNTDGSLDTNFGGQGANGAVYSISLQADGDIIIGGSFTSYDGVGRNRLARIKGGGNSYLSTSSLSVTGSCIGNSLNIPFTGAGTFNATNVFTAQLSDATGSFTNPTVIGTLSGVNTGTITGTIPASQPAGIGYRIRVVSSDPVLIGSDNGSNLAFNTLPSATINAPASLCNNATGSVVTLTGSGSTAPYTFTYNINGGVSQTVTTTSGNSVTIPITTSTPGNFIYNLTSVSVAGSCSQALNGSATVKVNSSLVISSSQTNVTTNGGANGTATVTVSGGTNPYTYSWNTSPVQTTATATGLTAGTFQVTVTDAANCSKTQTFTITQPALSNNADLSNLVLSSGTLTPAFAATTISYSASVNNATTSVTVTPTKAEANATIKVNGVTVISGNASSPINLNVGSNTITTTVTAQDGNTVKTYSIAITRAPSSNADLSGLTISSGTLTPAFTSGNTSYSASVTNATTSITVTPTKAETNATIKVNGNTVVSGSPSQAIALNTGANTVSILVTAQNGTTKTYSVSVTRALSANADLTNLAISSGSLAPVFISSTTGYTASVNNSTSTITVTPTKPDVNASITVNGNTVNSGSASPAIALIVGANTITTVVTAQDGTTTKTYSIVVTRAGSNNANLSGLVLSAGTLAPAFTTANINYTTTVNNSVSSVSITPTSAEANASILVNGNPVVSNNSSAPILLNVGSNTITTVVTAQDGSTTKTYTIVVNRDIATAINEELSKTDVHIFPNPNQGSCVIQLKGFEPGKSSLKVYDLLGKEIFVKNLDINTTEFSEKLLLPKVKGIYLLKIASGDQLITKKIVVE